MALEEARIRNIDFRWLRMCSLGSLLHVQRSAPTLRIEHFG